MRQRADRGRRRLAAMLVAVLVQGADIAAAAETSGKPPKDGMRVTGDRDLPMTLVVLPWLEPAVTLPPALMQSGLPQVFERDRSLVQDPLNRSVAVLQMAKQEAVDQAQVLEAEKEAAAKKRRRRSRSDGDE